MNATNPGAPSPERLEGMQAEARRQGVSVEEAIAANKSLPLGLLKTEEIADAVVYARVSRASYVTGALVAMDGALTPMV